MHPSYFSVGETSENDEKTGLAVPAEVSEWLFFKRFWNEFNQKYQTQFEQYEEIVLPSVLALAVAKRLNALKTEIQLQFEDEIRFRYGWKKDGEELLCYVKRAMLTEWISKLVELFELASQLKLNVYCQL